MNNIENNQINHLVLLIKKNTFLTTREIHVLSLWMWLHSTKKTALLLRISHRTVGHHRENILSKTEKRTISQLLEVFYKNQTYEYLYKLGYYLTIKTSGHLPLRAS